MILLLDNNNKVCYKLKYNNKGVEKCLRKKNIQRMLLNVL